MDNSDLQREKLKQIFNFLRELNKVKTPPISDVKQYNWKLTLKTLPTFPSIQVFNLESPSNAEGVILRVSRPKDTNCPQPPKEIKDWLEKGWDKLDGEVRALPLKNFEDKDGKTFTEAFDSDPTRVYSFQNWLHARAQWQEAERPVREAIKVYSDLFTLQGTFDRESEKYQLYIADGFFVTKSEFGEIHHPVLLKKVEFTFDPSKPEFIIYDGEDAPELYSALLRFHELNGEAISDCKLKVSHDEVHPVGNGKTEEFLKYFISRFFRDGEYFNERPEEQIDKPYIYRNPTLILSTKSQGFAEAIENLIGAIPKMEVLPEALLRIIGIDTKVSLGSGFDLPPEIPGAPKSNSSVDYLLTKPSNKEQERVIKKLEETGAVLVQGPPGTGKSHTIANILGHLLANGKRVLVASHTSKALRVVREQVVEELRPLCISVLDNDHESKGQLEDSINKIVNYHSKTDEKTLELEADQLNGQRKKLKEKLQLLNDLALVIRRSEYEDIVLCGESLNPSEAARFVKENSDLLSIIPSPVTLGAPFPLSADEVYRLYTSNSVLSIDEELALQSELPLVDDILKPSQVKELGQQATLLTSKDLNYGAEFWTHDNQNEDQLQNTIQLITSARRIFEAESWLRECIEASLQNTKEAFESPWGEFVRIVHDIHKQIRDHEVIESRHLPEPGPEATLELAIEIHNHLKSGGNLSSFSLMFRPSWKKFIQTSKVIDGQPKNIEHIESFVSHLQIKKLRRELSLRWERQVVSIGGKSLSVSSPERMAYSYAELIDNAIKWQDSWNIIIELSTYQGFNYQKFFTGTKEEFSNLGPLAQLQRAAERLGELLERRLKRVAYKQLNQKLEASLIQLRRANVNDNAKPIILNLEESLRELDSARYEEWFNVLVEISSKRPLAEMRASLVKKIARVSPMWTECLNLRREPHNSINPPGDMVKAWKVRQLNDLILDRHKHDYVKIQEDIAQTKKQLETLTANYVEKLAWRFQKKNTTQKSWQALQGWLLIQKRLSTTGQGKKDLVFLKEARKLIKEAKEAVPVWIMPLSKVSDNFDLGHSRFDVLILDEASQSDIMALIAFAIAKQVIVVGDNEQVTPYAVGMQINQVQVLIDEFLKGIPNAVLYDGKTSIYDLAQQSFGETIRLVEHFRCVPDIIGYSNQLSYNGEIKPLRESSSSPYKRHTINHRVMGSRDNGKTNQEEALEIASLIIAMINDPYYDLNDKNQKTSFGVVSLLGDEQAYLIESILRENLDPSVYKERRILCGNSSQFQGDERDVVFLSLVDSSEDGPQRLKRTPEFKKICNVAVSRARNQLWVVHSLNPATDLKDDDLRLQLIKYAENPKASEIRINDANVLAESPFEQSVQADLIRNGFKIIPQWRVGAYRIDMVAVGRNGKKIAIECDGEKYHSGDKMLDDLYRQTVLERLGWKFIRIRGSEYYRDPPSCMNKVIARLEHYKVERIAGEEDKVGSTFNEEQQEIIRKAYEIKETIKKKKESDAA